MVSGSGMISVNVSEPKVVNTIFWGNGTDEIASVNSTPVFDYSTLMGGQAACDSCTWNAGNDDSSPQSRVSFPKAIVANRNLTMIPV